MNTLLHDLGLLTMADVAELLHCSKAHVCKAVSGRVRGCPPIPAVSLGCRTLVRRETPLPGLPSVHIDRRVSIARKRSTIGCGIRTPASGQQRWDYDRKCHVSRG